jgi:alpha-beta hydrolase superfamily lysophospholipase
MQEINFSWSTFDDTEIYAKEWKPEQPSFVICLVHGLGEHINRYDHFARYFNHKNGVVIGYDQRGHGRSGGSRGHIPSYQASLDDVSKLLVQAETKYPNLPVILYGHSMGGALVMNYTLERHPSIVGLVASGPWIQLGFKASAIKVGLAKIADRLTPGLTQPSGLDPSQISSDPAEVKKYKEDSLIHDRISVRAANSYMQAGQQLEDYTGAFPMPLLLMHGAEDRVTSCDASQRFAERASGPVTFKAWPGMLHEIHNEPARKTVFDYTWNWMKPLL